MEQNGNQNLPPTTLCRTGCGFYGNASFDGMCSKCYKDALKRKQNSSSPVSSGRVSPTGEATTDVSSMSASLAQTTLGSSSSDTPPSNFQGLGVISRSPSTTSTTTPSVETAVPTVPVASSNQEKDSERTEEGAAGGSDVVSDDSKSDDGKDKKPKKNRCHTCKKKVGLTGFLCRCGGLFCSLHRYSDKHDCNFDYKELAQQQIRKNNPVVMGKKIQKI